MGRVLPKNTQQQIIHYYHVQEDSRDESFLFTYDLRVHVLSMARILTFFLFVLWTSILAISKLNLRFLFLKKWQTEAVRSAFASLRYGGGSQKKINGPRQRSICENQNIVHTICDILTLKLFRLSLIHIWRCRRSTLCRSRWSPYH